MQIEPVVLFADNASFYNGKIHATSVKIKEIVASLPKLQALVIFEEVSAVDMKEHLRDLKPPTGSSYTYQEFLARQVSETPLNSILLIPQPDHPHQTQASPKTNSRSFPHPTPSTSSTAPAQPENQNVLSTLPSEPSSSTKRNTSYTATFSPTTASSTSPQRPG